MVKNLLDNAGDLGLITAEKIPHASGQLELCITINEDTP